MFCIRCVAFVLFFVALRCVALRFVSDSFYQFQFDSIRVGFFALRLDSMRCVRFFLLLFILLRWVSYRVRFVLDLLRRACTFAALRFGFAAARYRFVLFWISFVLVLSLRFGFVSMRFGLATLFEFGLVALHCNSRIFGVIMAQCI